MGQKINKPLVTQEILDGIEAMQEDGSYNMFQWQSVAAWCLRNGHKAAGVWIAQNHRDYASGIIAGFTVVSALTEYDAFNPNDIT